MTDTSNITNNVIKLQVVSSEVSKVVSLDDKTERKLSIVANDSKYTDGTMHSSNHSGLRDPYLDQKRIMYVASRLSTYLKELINDNASSNYNSEEFHVNASDLSFEDQKIFLSHLVDAWDYEEYCSKPSLLRAAITDHLHDMQLILNEASRDVYASYVHDMGWRLEDEY